ncbi:MAG: hypothetical protein WB508_05010 [Aeromicrobium sp.]|uniref:hypothetical protein n=1 Tax=Aeromicrobium sp. TaxID=1871063 RepID=UPI003C5751A3
MNKRVVAVIAAGVLALAGVLVLLMWAKDADRRAYEGAKLTSVVQITEQIAVGTTAAELRAATTTVKIPSKTVPKGAVRTMEDVAGLVTSVPLEPGEVLLAARMVEPGAASGELGGVPEGLQEIAISLETAQLVAGDLREGDLVGVIAGYTNPEETVMVEDRALVMGTNVTDLAESAQGSAIVTVAVDEDIAKKIAHAGLFGRVWLTKQNELTKHEGGVIDRKDVTP